MARMATGDVDEALDLVQDAMLRLVKHYGKRPEREWGPLFHRILQSRIRDWYRRTRVRNRLRVWLRGDPGAEVGDALAQEPDPRETGPANNVAMRHTMRALEAALRDLPPRQQQVFMLRVWEGLDVADTASAMSCSQGSVKTHYFRAVRALRERLKDHWA